MEPSNSQQPTKLFWMISLADLLGVLLAFFAMNFAMSGVDLNNWGTIKNNIGNVFISPVDGDKTNFRLEPLPPFTSKQQITEIGYLEHVISGHIMRDLALSKMSVSVDGKNRLHIMLPTSALFENGSDTLSLEGISMAFYLGNMFYSLNNKLECHVIIPSAFQSDASFQHQWELSMQRAQNIAQELKNSGYGYNIPIFGRIAAIEDQAEAMSVESKEPLSAITIVVYPVKA